MGVGLTIRASTKANSVGQLQPNAEVGLTHCRLTCSTISVMDHRILQHRPQIHELCRRFNVSRLEIFGSAADPEHVEDPNDFDFLVDFKLNGELKALDAYFGLKESLEDLLGLPVDLVMPSALKNPYFRAQVERQKQPLYEA